MCTAFDTLCISFVELFNFVILLLQWMNCILLKLLKIILKIVLEIKKCIKN